VGFGLVDEVCCCSLKAHAKAKTHNMKNFSDEEKKEIMERTLKYEDGFRFLHCSHCLGEYLAEREANGGVSKESPRDAMNYEKSSVPFTYPDGTTANILALWCKKCGRPVWDTRHMTHLF
jgi:hypothetical protein